jgi:hypothetical protein
MECICRQCGKKFTAQRTTAKFCSPTCRVNFNRAKKDKQHKRVKKLVRNLDSEKTAGEDLKDSLPKNKKLAKAIMALIDNRKKILNKGYDKYATFILGNTFIQIGLREVIIGNMKYKLPKP